MPRLLIAPGSEERIPAVMKRALSGNPGTFEDRIVYDPKIRGGEAVFLRHPVTRRTVLPDLRPGSRLSGFRREGSARMWGIRGFEED